MIHIPKRGYIAIIGGRNDSIYEAMGANCFDDIHLIDYHKEVWIRVRNKGLSYEPRYGFSATHINDQNIFIVGGINNGLLLEQNPYSVLVDTDDKVLEALCQLEKDAIDVSMSNTKLAKKLGLDVFGSLFHNHISGINIDRYYIVDKLKYTDLDKEPGFDNNKIKKKDRKKSSIIMKENLLETFKQAHTENVNIFSSYNHFMPNPDGKFVKFFNGKIEGPGEQDSDENE